MEKSPEFANRILSRLDGFLHKNDYESADAYLSECLLWAKDENNIAAQILVLNEQMGLLRKTGQKERALCALDEALSLVERAGLGENIGSATTYLNGATVYKAFSMAHRAIPLFERARRIYEANLEKNDERLGGLYNNMGLALVDLGRFSEANELYQRAISIMKGSKNGDLEVAVTYLNMASAAEAEFGLEKAETSISEYLEAARVILESHPKREGYYAFVCEKCASVFGYYGHFMYQRELTARARRIYEGN